MKNFHSLSIENEKARTYAFLAMSFTQLFNALNLRSLRQSIFNLSFNNYYLIFGFIFSLFLQYLVIFNESARSILGFGKITFFEFFVIFIFSSIILLIGEIYKFFKRKLELK